jgi:hypothetical protein
VTEVRERLAVNKQRLFLNEVEGKEQFPVEVSNRFAALEDLDAEVDINSVWEPIRENFKISAKERLCHELKKHKEFRITGFLDFAHHPEFEILENTTFGKWICFCPQERG